MHSHTQIDSLRAALAALRRQGRRIAFVPTMGNLHAGHMRLVQQAQQLADEVVVSIFVNPMQFGPHEDFASYPRTLSQDQEVLAAAGVNLVFVPDQETIYPRGLAVQTCVEVPGLSEILDGATRPGHFRGVTTVVNRLFNIVAPEVALFGKKDYQQWVIIQRMVEDLAMPLSIVGVDTVREADGLALSSRNQYLSASERALAPQLYTCLQALAERLQQAPQDLAGAEQDALATLETAGFRTDYVSIRRQRDLEVPTEAEFGSKAQQIVLLSAARLGSTRLIDNLEVEIPGAL